MSEHQPTLVEITNISTRNLVRQALREMLGVPQEILIEGLDFTNFETQRENPDLFLQTNDLSQTLDSFGESISKYIENIAKQQIPELQRIYKKFNTWLTKLPQETVENIWDGLSVSIRNRIYSANEEEVLPIFSLEKCLKSGKILKKGKEEVKLSGEEESTIREKILGNLPSANDQGKLWEKLRNVVFNYFQQSYGAFKSPETKAEISKA